uniref:Glycosyl hydrolase family protein n=1 Tax=Caldilinea aerophila TaxID=133453 RepID=A0A7C1FI67_9CHLR
MNRHKLGPTFNSYLRSALAPLQLIPLLWIGLLWIGLSVALSGCQPPFAISPAPTVGNGDLLLGWELVWSDEFDGQALNSANWVAEIGAGGWGNNELQFYTDRLENLRIENGILVIEARKEVHRGSPYTSARIKTQGKQVFQYGRIEARMKLPTGKGIWPAFWMLGETLPQVGWPRAGEIDIMENIGEPYAIYGTVHGPGYSGGNGVGKSYTVAGPPLYEDFHIYAIEWAPGEIRWFLDDVLFNTVTERDVPGPWVFDQPFFILLNLAVGGNWPGYPDETTQFPQQLLVDFVRVYRDPELELQPRKSLYAADVRLQLVERDDATLAEAWVTVVDEEGNPVGGAVVSGGWLGVSSGATLEASSDADGQAGPFTGRVVSSAREVSFCISSIYKAGAIYDKTRNQATCAFQSR